MVPVFTWWVISSVPTGTRQAAIIKPLDHVLAVAFFVLLANTGMGTASRGTISTGIKTFFATFFFDFFFGMPVSRPRGKAGIVQQV
jgi:hypothetical protein